MLYVLIFGAMRLQEFKKALEQEDYAKAAQLRDSGCAGLVGWWHSRAEDDPLGHVLRITPDFGRYTAVKYSALDLAELKVFILLSHSCNIRSIEAAK